LASGRSYATAAGQTCADVPEEKSNSIRKLLEVKGSTKKNLPGTTVNNCCCGAPSCRYAQTARLVHQNIPETRRPVPKVREDKIKKTERTPYPSATKKKLRSHRSGFSLGRSNIIL